VACKYNFHSISLKNKTYSELNEIAAEIAPGEHLSQSKTVESLVFFYRSLHPKTKETINDSKSEHKTS